MNSDREVEEWIAQEKRRRSEDDRRESMRVLRSIAEPFALIGIAVIFTIGLFTTWYFVWKWLWALVGQACG